MSVAPVANPAEAKKRLPGLTPIVSSLRSLFKKTPPIQSNKTLSPPQRQEYERLQANWDARSSDFKQRMAWIYEMTNDYGEQYVNDFLEWVNTTRDTRSTQFDEVSNERFASCLSGVDWMQRNYALKTVNARLWNRYISVDPDLYIGHYKRIPLTVRLNGRVLNPPESDWRQYDVSSVNPPILLGLRYKPLNEKLKTQVFLFVTLGELICMPLKAKCVCEKRLMLLGNIYSSQQKEGGRWDDTDFILLLEVNSSGRRGGLYICYSSTDPDLDGDFESGGGEELIPTFPGALSSFTLAKVSPADINKGSSSYVDLEPLQKPLQSKPTIDIAAVSNVSLEVAETGMRGDWSLDNPPIPLFAVGKGEQASGSGI